ncbi:hypothetical protein BDEG_24661 [Batrachochytrium dendrobatidis JEL423]|uniref:Integrase catalytic domain-containing protein n=1 Tax=Batrachochytrium dendrobatidis (strain JEL423) TaxID=403673 RepID=A0A177WMT9_BATDL|nr:hypothetical protein BDEG_24661 [Batrachochytrium dendrobatidis JEL423]
MDLAGPFKIESLGKAKHYLIIVDDFSRYSHLYTLQAKSQTSERLKDHIVLMETGTGIPVRHIRSDNGGEFLSQEFTAFLKEKGIEHQTTAPYTPQHNGVAEQRNRSIGNAIRSMILSSGLPKRFWAEAAATAVYLQNRSPHSAINNLTPYEKRSGKKPWVSHLKTFGCKANAVIPSTLLGKLDSRTSNCVMLGYKQGSKAYRLYDLDSKKTILTRDAKFNEDNFPFKHQKTSQRSHKTGNLNIIQLEISRTQELPVKKATPAKEVITVTETQQEENLDISSQAPTIIATSEYNDGTYPTVHQFRPNPDNSTQTSQIIRSGGVTTKNPFASSSPSGFNPSRLPNPLRSYKGYQKTQIRVQNKRNCDPKYMAYLTDKLASL